MPDCALEFSNVIVAGNDPSRGHWHVYYRRFFVGTISYEDGAWSASLHLGELPLGRFADLEDARRAVAEWYYGPRIMECPHSGPARQTR